MDEPVRKTIGGYGALDPPEGVEGLERPAGEGFDLSLQHGAQYLAVAGDPERSEGDRARAALRLGMFPGLLDGVVALACDASVPAVAAEYVGVAAVSLLRHSRSVSEADIASFAPAARMGAQRVLAATSPPWTA